MKKYSKIKHKTLNSLSVVYSLIKKFFISSENYTRREKDVSLWRLIKLEEAGS